MMFGMPEMMPRGPGGRGCGRGRGMGRGGFGMGRGGMGRPEPRWMDCGGPQCGPDPRQMAYGGMYPGYGAMGCPPFQGPPAMWGPPPMMPWAGYQVGPPHMPWFGPFRGRGRCWGPRRAWRFHKLMEEMQQEDKDNNTDSENVKHTDKKGEDKSPDGKLGEKDGMQEEGTESSPCGGCCRDGPGRWGKHQGRPWFVRRLNRFLAQMEESSDTSSGSDSEDDAAAAKEKECCHHKGKKWAGKKGCRRAWRQFMRRQFHGCPPGPYYGGGPPMMMGWSPAWQWSAGCGGPQGRPGLPPHLLQRLRRVLTALEADTNRQGNSEKTQASEGQTGEEQVQGQAQNADPSCRRARLQARLRRLINHVERQNENQDLYPPHHWMMQMQGGAGWCQKPRHMKRIIRQMRRAEKCQDGDSNEDSAEEDVTEEGACGDDVTMTTANPGPLEDWENLRKDVEQLQTSQNASQDSGSCQSKCPTCHRATSPQS